MSYEMIKGQPIVMTYNIMLKENALTNQRSYTQLIDILGDVGGLMEVIESIFGVFCIFVTDILYDKTMVLLAAATLLLCNKENFSTPMENPWQFFISCALLIATAFGTGYLKINPIRMICYAAFAGLLLLY